MSRSSSSTEPDYSVEGLPETIVLPMRGRGAPSRGDSAVSPASSYERPRDSRRSHDQASYASDVLVPVTHSHRPSSRRVAEGDTVMADQTVVQPSMASYIPASQDHHYDQPSRQPYQNAAPSLAAFQLDELLTSIRTMCDPLASYEEEGDAFCIANRHLATSGSNYTLVDKTYVGGMRTTISQLENQLRSEQDKRTIAEKETADLQRQLAVSNANWKELQARCERLDISSKYDEIEHASLVMDLLRGIATQNTSSGQGMPRANRGHPSGP